MNNLGCYGRLDANREFPFVAFWNDSTSFKAIESTFDSAASSSLLCSHPNRMSIYLFQAIKAQQRTFVYTIVMVEILALTECIIDVCLSV